MSLHSQALQDKNDKNVDGAGPHFNHNARVAVSERPAWLDRIRPNGTNTGSSWPANSDPVPLYGVGVDPVPLRGYFESVDERIKDSCTYEACPG